MPVMRQGDAERGEGQREAPYGITLGTFPALVCDRCGESFTD